MSTESMAFPFPLRNGYLAQIVVPRDMTKQEADRLCEFVKSLAMPEPTASIAASQENGE